MTKEKKEQLTSDNSTAMKKNNNPRQPLELVGYLCDKINTVLQTQNNFFFYFQQ